MSQQTVSMCDFLHDSECWSHSAFAGGVQREQWFFFLHEQLFKNLPGCTKTLVTCLFHVRTDTLAAATCKGSYLKPPINICNTWRCIRCASSSYVTVCRNMPVCSVLARMQNELIVQRKVCTLGYLTAELLPYLFTHCVCTANVLALALISQQQYNFE